MKCGKAYLEQKIEEGEKRLKCPFFKCNYIISEDILTNLVTAKHMENYKIKLAIVNLNSPMGSGTVDTNRINIISNPNDFLSCKVNSETKLKHYLQKHVFDMSNNESFFIFNKAKEQYCARCYEPSLFGKNGSKFVKCLNCMLKFCKFCSKEITSDHFNVAAFNYCKVYFKKKFQFVPPLKAGLCKEVLLNILLFVVGYFVFLIGIFKYISNYYYYSLLKIENKEQHNMTKIKCQTSFSIYLLYFSYILLMILSFTVIFPFLLALIPYFSLIIFLWN